tara:strand:+ start:92 stop:1144 length:1053 start_codon:yes stop_codon:yes gene_type:complete
MAYTTINKHTAHFNTKLYTGNGTAIGSGGNAITGVGFQPDFTWIKSRSGSSRNHYLYDAVRGVEKRLMSNESNAEATLDESLEVFGTDGFTVGDHAHHNYPSETYASWNWKANGAGSTNTDGSVDSTVSLNTTAGFSIVKFNVGSSGGDITVGHGLGVVPKVIMIKSLADAYNWDIYHASVVNSKRLILNTDATQSNSSYMSSTSPTSSVFTFKQTHYSSGADAIAYCFAEKVGYSKFGKYIGNGSTDGTFTYLGFKPSLVISKRTDSTAPWYMMTAKISDSEGGNPLDRPLFANTNDDENDGDNNVDLLSNGFKIRDTGTHQNGSGATYVYMAFGQSIVGSNNVPCTAR